MESCDIIIIHFKSRYPGVRLKISLELLLPLPVLVADHWSATESASGLKEVVPFVVI